MSVSGFRPSTEAVHHQIFRKICQTFEECKNDTRNVLTFTCCLHSLSGPPISAVPSSLSSQAPPLSLTNTRQIGIKHLIELQRGPRGFGIGLTSRDVRTNEKSQPVYVKAVHHDGPAYLDGQVQIGDRILEVCLVECVCAREFVSACECVCM